MEPGRSLAMGILLSVVDEPFDPWASLPWKLVGIGVFVILGSYALLVIMLRIFPRGRRLDDEKKPQETALPKKRRPRKHG
jgi:hypothetical protein